MQSVLMTIPEVSEAIKTSKYFITLTGAGVSTLSGIPDFRSASTGVYSKPWHGRSVEEILSIDCFLSRPELFYQWATEFVYRADDFAPNIVHTSLANLEKQGYLKRVYTQNIDILHTRAGSINPGELHGSAAHHHCLSCGEYYSYNEIAPEVMSGKVPRCCKCGGLVKPNIVFYGEGLDEKLWREAEMDFTRADLLLVLGSSLTVYPVASLPELTFHAEGKIVLVNAQPTPLDRRVAGRFSDLESFFMELNKFF